MKEGFSGANLHDRASGEPTADAYRTFEGRLRVSYCLEPLVSQHLEAKKKEGRERESRAETRQERKDDEETR